MKIVTIVGARPQFIKASAVSRAIASFQGGRSPVREVLVHTGQHYDQNMSDIFFQEMEIPKPQYHLEIGGGSHGAMTGLMLQRIEPILIEEKPDWVLVYGDTNSTLAGAIAAVKLHQRVAHVEAGLRSFNRKMPEEINRILTDHSSEVLFTPTDAASKQLVKESIPESKVHQVGDVMYDVALHYRKRAASKTSLVNQLGLRDKEFVLATVHRQENTDDSERLALLMKALISIGESIPVVLPLHPRTRQALDRLGMLSQVVSKLKVIDPVGYLEMIQLESGAKVILTDSGGVQKEAFFYQVPCVILREETEWGELVDRGYNRLVSFSTNDIEKQFQIALNTVVSPDSMIYGDGSSSNKIVSKLWELQRL